MPSQKRVSLKGASRWDVHFPLLVQGLETSMLRLLTYSCPRCSRRSMAPHWEPAVEGTRKAPCTRLPRCTATARLQQSAQPRLRRPLQHTISTKQCVTVLCYYACITVSRSQAYSKDPSVCHRRNQS